MSPPLTLLSLPPELRAQIYRSYLFTEGGYFHNYETGKLTTKNNQPVDLALMSTCRLIATEMRGMPLGMNTVTFTTFYSDNIRARAGLWDCVLSKLWLAEIDRFFRPEFLDPSGYDQLYRRYPQFASVLDFMRENGTEDVFVYATQTWGESLSLSRHFISEALGLMSRHQDFDRVMEAHEYTANAREIISQPRFPWVLPDMEILARLAELLDIDSSKSYPQRWKYRLSAATVAVQFLSSLNTSTRSQFRNILVHEDQPSAAYPWTHGQGLISFCQENPHMSIERRVSFWKAVLVGHAGYVASYDENLDRYEELSRHLTRHTILASLSRWMTEGLALTVAGMPRQSFILTFDGENYADGCSEMFRKVIHRAAAWHKLAEDFHTRGLSTTPLFERTFRRYYVFTGFHEAIQHIVQGNSSIRFNFDIGPSIDVESLISTQPDYNLKEARSWLRSWRWSGEDQDHNNRDPERYWGRGEETWNPSSTETYYDLILEHVIQQ